MYMGRSPRAMIGIQRGEFWFPCLASGCVCRSVPIAYCGSEDRGKADRQRRATVTTASNKVQLARSIAAAALLHLENPNPSNPEGFGTPHGSRELSSELVVWYYPPGRHVNAKNNKKGRHPPCVTIDGP